MGYRHRRVMQFRGLRGAIILEMGRNEILWAVRVYVLFILPIYKPDGRA